MAAYLEGLNTLNTPDVPTYLARLDADLARRASARGAAWPGIRAVLTERGHKPLRIALTRADPLLFAVCYLSHMITDKHGKMWLGEMHLDICRWALSWLKPLEGEAGPDDLFLGPRRYGKSQWLTRIIPLWAMAHMHGSRRPGRGPFILLVSATDVAVNGHYGDVEAELLNNELYAYDYPDAVKRVPNRRAKWASVNGSILLAVSFESKVRGINVQNRDPDRIIGDDLEDDFETQTTIDKNVQTWNRKIRMLSPEAGCVIAGTTVNYRGLIHQLAMKLFEPWSQIPEEIRAWIGSYHTWHYPPLIETGDPADPERSTMPGKWSVKYLQKLRETKKLLWELEWLNHPSPLNGTWWTRDGFTYVEVRDFIPVEVGIFVDSARMENPRKADETGICVAGVDANLRVAIYAVEGIRGLVGDALDEKVYEIARYWCEESPTRFAFTPTFIAAEANGIGDQLRTILKRSGAYLNLVLFYSSNQMSKEQKFIQVAMHYANDGVVHVGHQSVEAQMSAFTGKGSLAQDGQLDAVSFPVLWWRAPEWIRPPEEDLHYASGF